MTHSWRDSARPIIAEVIQRVGVKDREALRRAIRDAYPFGERKYWPYKAWLSEVRAQLGGPIPKNGPLSRLPEKDRRQIDLFDGQTFVQELDGERLNRQFDRVLTLMRDARWRTLPEIQVGIRVIGRKDTEAAISARLRDLRKKKFGAHEVERRRRGDPRQGLWEYRLLVNTRMAPETGCDQPDSARDAMPITPAAGAPCAIPYVGVIRHPS